MPHPIPTLDSKSGGMVILTQEVMHMHGGIIWTIVGVLLIIALLIWIF